MKRILSAIALLVLGFGQVFAQQRQEEQGQTIRIVSEHRATHDSEKTYHTSFNQRQLIGVLGDKKYTLSCLDAFGIAKGIEVGKEYRVVKVSRNDLTIEVPIQTKKGERIDKTELHIVTVELADPK